MTPVEQAIDAAAQAIRGCDALLIGAGAGMGVDSGMPDFRGDQGFWKAYPAFKGKRFSDMSNPAWFARDPNQAWGFFGHRYNMYSQTKPHAGFKILKQFSHERQVGIFTSNVDGHFQKSGFTDVPLVECHGSIHYLQCSELCCQDIWPAGELSIEVDPDTIQATGPLPTCPKCSAVARPNILMFGDYSWIQDRTARQEQEFAKWMEAQKRQTLVAIELGAGTAIPTVRWECERHGGTLIRINPRDPEVDVGEISIPLGALEALQRIAALLN